MKMSDFTLKSLGLKGNYLVTISYIEADADENHFEFVEFLNRHKNLSHDITESYSLKIAQKNHSNVLPPAPNNTSIEASSVPVKVNEISYEVFCQSKDSIPARNISRL